MQRKSLAGRIKKQVKGIVLRRRRISVLKDRLEEARSTRKYSRLRLKIRKKASAGMIGGTNQRSQSAFEIVEKQRKNALFALMAKKKLKIFFYYLKILQFKRSKRGKKRVSCPVLA